MTMEIHYLNVAEGDCSIVKHDSGRISMVDICCGNLEAEKELTKDSAACITEDFGVKGNFKQKEYPVNPLDWLGYLTKGRIFRFILTHPDMDHMDGIKALFESEYKPCNFWDTNNNKKLDASGSFGRYSVDDWKFYDEHLHVQTLEDVTFLKLHAGQGGKFYNQDNDSGEGFGDRIEILSPSKKTEGVVEQSENINDISYVLLMKTGCGRKILFCGDTEEDAWAEILKHYRDKVSNVDVLFPPHHGRESGGNDNFLDVLNPKITIFGNAKSGYLDYDAWNSRRLLHFTNNQIGSVVLNEVNGKFEVWATGKKFIAKWRTKMGWSHSTEDTLYSHDKYPVWFLTSI